MLIRDESVEELEDFELRLRKLIFRDLCVLFVLFFLPSSLSLLLLLCCCFFKPKSSLHRLEHLGAFGENNKHVSAREMRSFLVRNFGVSGDLTPAEVEVAAAVWIAESCRGTSFPSEKSSSAAGNIITGSSSRNSKSAISLTESSGSRTSGLFTAVVLLDQTKDLYLVGGQSRKFSDEIVMLFKQADEVMDSLQKEET